MSGNTRGGAACDRGTVVIGAMDGAERGVLEDGAKYPGCSMLDQICDLAALSLASCTFRFSFIRLFCHQVLTCVSDSCRT